MPKSVLQSNWYYGASFSRTVNYVAAYRELERHGYDQIPTGSNWSEPQNFERTVRYGMREIAPRRLKGFLQCSWRPTLNAYRQHHLEAVEQAGRAVRWVSRHRAPQVLARAGS